MKVPKLGNIWIGGELIGFRDFTTGDFTPAAGKENWSLVSDNACENNPLLTDQGIAVTDQGEFSTDTGGI